ncbi:MAG: transposase [Bacillota bacterium]
MPGIPHHVTQRGNRRLSTFFCDNDYKRYIEIMSELCAQKKVEIWAYCLMPNHIHLIAVPETEESLAGAIGEAHRRYTWLINSRQGWKGYLWQGRFTSFPMDEAHLYLAVAYVELNPVRAGMVKEAWQYRWSSAAAHISGRDDNLVRVEPLLNMFGDWRKYLSLDIPAEDTEMIKQHIKTGMPLGNESFISELEERYDMDFRPGKRGPKGPWKHKKALAE